MTYIHSLGPDNPFLQEPGIVVIWPPEKKETIVDGSHRLVRRAMLGLDYMTFWMVPEPIWRRCLLNWPSWLEAG